MWPDCSAAENACRFGAFFEDVTVADVGGPGNAFAGKGALEAEIGHGGGDHAVAASLFCDLRNPPRRGDAISIDDSPGFGDERLDRRRHRTPHPAWRAQRHALLQTFEMERAAAGV